MPLMWELQAGRASARISSLGAELRTLHLGGLDLLRNPDAVWNGISPILFPIVGWARDGQIRVNGQAYPMEVHGFAAGLTFKVVDGSASHVVLEARDTDQTRVHYPFGFVLRMSYALEPKGLTLALEVENPAQAPMPYACGFHPGFRLPFAGGDWEDHAISFEVSEPPHVPVIAPGGLFSHQTRAIPLQGRHLRLSPALLAHEALCFLSLKSRSLTLAQQGGPALHIAWNNFSHVALWGRPPSPFISIETWTGHGDPVGFAGDLQDKPSMCVLAPGATARHQMSIALLA